MSWQAYVDTSLIATGKIDKAAIFSAAGDSAWAVSANFKPEPAEIKALVAGFSDEAASLRQNGIYIEKTKYFFLRNDDRSIYGKKEKTGIICVKTKLAILVAHYPETVQPGEAVKIVEGLADYLIGVGY
ncbi:profilin [Sphaerosporella brunnea]|uniref:Profilin n=1 Tax=Sphaerosporella brunnea TaxID=1250544 RepID=A0A5J5F1E0_9PEZI|nr:profilin [Sphaerosporella brunnea]